MSLYDHNLVDYNIKTGFNQAYSEGFIQLWGLQTRMHNILKRKTGEKKTGRGEA
jgi:argininosuccinate synthase